MRDDIRFADSELLALTAECRRAGFAVRGERAISLVSEPIAQLRTALQATRHETTSKTAWATDTAEVVGLLCLCSVDAVERMSACVGEVLRPDRRRVTSLACRAQTDQSFVRPLVLVLAELCDAIVRQR